MQLSAKPSLIPRLCNSAYSSPSISGCRAVDLGNRRGIRISSHRVSAGSASSDGSQPRPDVVGVEEQQAALDKANSEAAADGLRR